ncbi:MAG: Ribonuclease 3 [Parcubacteria group bacterium GW2011_GWA1_40_21]|nr:MAG: Ribonuclease 3 [Parcubacteria group bacterium GW2011_GWC1_40_13]KKR53342.1 MAG: Ribonuclease 3 [Parcubacteria group bacterium GW2011_GWA1_40_21]
MTDFSKFEKTADISFKNKDLLKQAFTHRSFVNENKAFGLGHNERLEFLGDAVLELVVTEYLYSKYPSATEGDLTSYRSALVNAITLSEVARKLNVNEFLLLSKGEAKDEGRARLYILANTIEAIIGAVFLDQGYETARKFISENTFHLIDKIVEDKTWLDSKSYFQEMAQEYTGITPSYKTVKEEGPDHDRHFTVGVYLEKELVVSGEGKSKQEAEQDAARKALQAKGWLK